MNVAHGEPRRTAARGGRVAYAALFMVVLPALAALWAVRLDALLHLPAPGLPPAAGYAAAFAGAVVIVAGVAALWIHGHGLPMSPFPPARLVTRGVYGLVAHPIYSGTVLLAAGVSIAACSAAGLWMVTPAFALTVAAFVLGYERDATRGRFAAEVRPLLRLPAAEEAAPTLAERAAVAGLAFLPWLALYEAVQQLGLPPDARSTFLSWEAQLPVVPWTEAIYAAAYPLILLAPFAARRRDDLRRFALEGLWATAGITLLYLLLPLVAPPKAVAGTGFWPALMRLERAADGAAGACPAFHVVWAGIAAELYARSAPRWRALAWAAAAAVAASCVTTGMHSLGDVAAGAAAYALVARGGTLWRWLHRGAEAVANSWAEWDLGPVRCLSHGLYAALAVVTGAVVAERLAGSAWRWWILASALAAELGALLWAQLIEGSPELLRPYGYFGGVAAATAVGTVAGARGTSAWPLLAALAVGAAFGQAIGRLRCLVQGCCHGREAAAGLGIRYLHPRSRVVRLSGLGGVAVHPTPLYSLLWTLLAGCLLARLWTLHAPLQLIGGSYLILIGLGRFVEEHFRGEPQTATPGGLRLYQWLAILFVAAGAAVTALGADPAPPAAAFDPGFLPLAAGLGVVSYAAFGIDFPRSARRFSRLV